MWRESNLVASWERVKRNKGAAGIDRQSVEAFSRYAKEEISKLERQLQTGEYEPKAVKRVYIEKAGSAEKRPLGIPAVRDRVVQGAVKQVLEPIFEQSFAEHSYGLPLRRLCSLRSATMSRGTYAPRVPARKRSQRRAEASG